MTSNYLLCTPGVVKKVCKAWKAVIEESRTLQYLIWLGVHGQVDKSPLLLPAPDTKDTIAERLSQLLAQEQAWAHASFARRDLVDVDSRGGTRLQLRDWAVGQASVLDRVDEEVALCKFPWTRLSHSIKDEGTGGGPVLLDAKKLALGEISIGAQDYWNDVLIMLSR